MFEESTRSSRRRGLPIQEGAPVSFQPETGVESESPTVLIKIFVVLITSVGGRREGEGGGTGTWEMGLV